MHTFLLPWAFAGPIIGLVAGYLLGRKSNMRQENILINSKPAERPKKSFQQDVCPNCGSSHICRIKDNATVIIGHGSLQATFQMQCTTCYHVWDRGV